MKQLEKKQALEVKAQEDAVLQQKMAVLQAFYGKEDPVKKEEEPPK